jgi:hypothetical protein
MHTITLIIDNKGGLKISVDGLKGTACKDATKTLERALGTVKDDQKTSEFYQQPQANNQQKLGY